MDARSREMAQWLLLLLAPHLLAGQPVEVSPMGVIYSQQRFHDSIADSRWSAGAMDYIDGVSSSVLQHPYTIVFDYADSSFFIASFTLNHIVQMRMSSSKRAQYKIFCSGSELDGPVGMVVDFGVLFVASFTNDHVLRINATDGTLLGRIGNEMTLDCPEGVALGPTDGRLYVASFLLPHLSVFDPQTSAFLGKFGALPRAATSQPSVPVPKSPVMNGAEDLTFDLFGDIHVTAYYSNAIFKFNGTTGERVMEYGRGVVRGPVGIACDPWTGDVLVASYKSNQVLRFSPEGQFVGVAAGSAERQRLGGRAAIASPTGLAFAGDGTMWVASYTSGTVTRFNSSGMAGRASARTWWRVTD